MEKCGYGQLNLQGKIGGRRGRSKVFLKCSPESLAADSPIFKDTGIAHETYTSRFNKTTNLTDGEKQFLRENHNHFELIDMTLSTANTEPAEPSELSPAASVEMNNDLDELSLLLKTPDNELRDSDFAPAPSSQESTKGDTPIVKRLRIRKGYSNYKY